MVNAVLMMNTFTVCMSLRHPHITQLPYMICLSERILPNHRWLFSYPLHPSQLRSLVAGEADADYVEYEDEPLLLDNMSISSSFLTHT